MHRYCLIVLLTIGLIACGLKGPLYLPEEPPPKMKETPEDQVKP
ncbi:MAG: lipoprotein [Nitrosomonas sp.]|nr:lipoprotein [Nitrosomonas sp.]MBK7365384.1 lipoprotein [Nitrosomonas sp.]